MFKTLKFTAMTAKFLATASIGLGTLAGATYTPANAASDYYCKKYANNAVIQHAKNVRLGCGYGGVRWKYDKAGHFLYCKVVPKSIAKGENATRNRKLAQCQQFAGGGNNQPVRSCKGSFKISHVAQNKAGARLGAGFNWVRAVKDNYGNRYSNWANAKNKSNGCVKRVNGSYKCYVRARPCKA